MKFVLATGASGGHLFPALSVAEDLARRGHEVVIVGSLLAQARHLQERHLSFHDIATVGFSRGRRFKAVYLMAKALWRSFTWLGKHRPDLVIGFGGHGSFAVVQAALWRAIPAMIHEQNVRPGRANRWLSRFVKKIAVSFDVSGKYFKPGKICVTGCPTHLKPSGRHRSDLLKEWRFSSSKSTLLVFGGSQGSRRINEAFLKACEELKRRIDLQVIHVCGSDDLERFVKEYARLNIDARVFKFLDRMEDAYLLSDVVISRAGAVTVTELAFFHKKAVLIPYPFAGGHQMENARVIKEEGSCEIIEDKMLTSGHLAEKVYLLLKSATKQQSDKKTGLSSADPSKRIADLALSLV